MLLFVASLFRTFKQDANTMKAYTLGLPLLAATAALVPAMASAERATGGSVTHFDQYALHTFDQPGAYSFTPNEALSVDLLLVAGGGAGGPQGGGGGGAGQVVVTNLTLQAGVSYAVIVGDGGRCDQIYDTWEWNVACGDNGGNSSFGDVESENYTGVLALGGGGGGGWNKAGKASANSGGSSIWCGSTASTLAEGGHAGGGTSYGAFGGGAGAGGDGGTPRDSVGPAGDGGPGVLLDFTGVPTWYAGGGGAAGGNSDSNIVPAGKGGSGIGGDGAPKTSEVPGGAGVPGTGSGGGGGSRDNLVCGGAGGSGVVIVKYADTFPASVNPTLGTPGVANVTPGSATSSLLVIDPGQGATECTVSLVYGLTESVLSKTIALGSAEAMDRVSVPMAGAFAPGRRYYAKYVAENTEGGRTETAVFSFTMADEGASASVSPYAGLIQSRSEGGNGDVYNSDPLNFDILSESDTTRTLGVVMANVNKLHSYANPLDGLSYAWPYGWSETPWLTYAYDGYMWMDSSLTYTFGFHVDEYATIYIDDIQFVNRTGGWTTKDFTPETTGWHAFRVYIPGKDYDKGPRGKEGATTTWNDTLGLAFRTDGGTPALPQNAWTPLVDPGDGSLFVTKTGFRSVTLGSWTYENGLFGAALTFGDRATLDATLVAYYGATWGGNDASAWDGSTTIGAITVSDSSYNVSALAVPASAHYVRFALVFPAASGLAPAWSETAALDEASLPAIVSLGATGVDGDRATLSANLTAVGAGAASATVSIEFGEAGGALSTLGAGTYTAASAVNYPLTDLVPGTEYQFRFLVVNTEGGVANTLFETFTTPAATVLGSTATASLSQSAATLSGTVATLGAGTTTVYLLLGPDAESMETVDSKVVTEAGLVAFAQTVEFGNSYAFQIVCSNSCAGLSWDGASNIATFTCTDRYEYYWNFGDGYWNDTDSWWHYGSSDCVGFPAAGATAVFQGRETNSTVTIRRPESFGQINFNGGGHRIRFVSDSLDNTMSSTGAFNWGGNAHATFDHVDFRSSGEFFLGKDSTFTLTNGACFYTGTYNGAMTNLMWTVSGGSSFVSGSNLMLGWGGSVFAVDNSSVVVSNDVQFTRDTPVGVSPGALRFSGKAPTFRVGASLMCYESNRESPSIVFDIPREGYTTVPIAPLEGNTRRLGNTAWPNSNVPMIVTVPADAEVVKGAKSVNQLLIDWPRGIDTNSFVFGDVPNPQNDYFYWGPLDREEGAEPTQLWVRVQATGGLTLILLR